MSHTIRAVGGALFLAVAASCGLAYTAGAQPAEASAKALMAKYANSDDTDALLREPAVRAQLQKLLGPQLTTLERNLVVSGSVDVIGGALSISGNAPHAGAEEEAVVCVAPMGPVVQAAIFSKGKTTVFASETNYEYLFRCIKDWITLVKSQHVDRMERPADVNLVQVSGELVRNLAGEYAYLGSGVARVVQKGTDIQIFMTWTPVGNGPHYEARGKLVGDTIVGQWYSHYAKKGWFRFVGRIAPDGDIELSQSDDPINAGMRKCVLTKR